MAARTTAPTTSGGSTLRAASLGGTRRDLGLDLARAYARTAVGAGIPKSIVVARNVLRNALITPVTVLGLRIGYLMGGAVVIEIIFSVDGMGKAVLLKGIQENWVTLVQGGALVVAIAFIVVNIIVDMLYLLINPRIRSV